MALDLEETARLAGGYCWLETRLFGILGAWVPATPEPEAKLLVDRHSLHHAWRAGQWHDRLPVVADIDREALVASPGAEATEVCAGLARLDSTPERLAGVYRLALPRLAVAYRRMARDLSPVSDSSLLRTLRILITDLTSDWQEGEGVLQGVLADRASVTAAAGAVAGLEVILADRAGPG